MGRKNTYQTKSAMRQLLKKNMINRADVDMSNINSSEFKEKADEITAEYIVSQMFNREIFHVKLEDACMFVLLNDECQQLIKEFAEADYRRAEGKFLVRTAGIRYEKCTEFKMSGLYGLAMGTTKE